MELYANYYIKQYIFFATLDILALRTTLGCTIIKKYEVSHAKSGKVIKLLYLRYSSGQIFYISRLYNFLREGNGMSSSIGVHLNQDVMRGLLAKDRQEIVVKYVGKDFDMAEEVVSTLGGMGVSFGASTLYHALAVPALLSAGVAPFIVFPIAGVVGAASFFGGQGSASAIYNLTVSLFQADEPIEDTSDQVYFYDGLEVRVVKHHEDVAEIDDADVAPIQDNSIQDELSGVVEQ